MYGLNVGCLLANGKIVGLRLFKKKILKKIFFLRNRNDCFLAPIKKLQKTYFLCNIQHKNSVVTKPKVEN